MNHKLGLGVGLQKEVDAGFLACASEPQCQTPHEIGVPVHTEGVLHGCPPPEFVPQPSVTNNAGPEVLTETTLGGEMQCHTDKNIGGVNLE